MHDHYFVAHNLNPYQTSFQITIFLTLCRESIYFTNSKNAKIGDLYLFSSRKFEIILSKTPFCGGCPRYWSPEQGTLFESLK